MRMLSLLVALWLTPSVLAAPQDLLGAWQCHGEEGTITLDFQSENQLRYDGAENSYRVQDDALLIQGLFGDEKYRYVLQGKKLTLTFPDGGVLRCQRPDALLEMPMKQGAHASDGALSGRLCQRDESIDEDGNRYVRLSSLAFDGEGHAVYVREGTTDEAAGAGVRGIYEVHGNQVLVRLADGHMVVAEVDRRERDGRITQLKVNGKRWAANQCE